MHKKLTLFFAKISAKMPKFCPCSLTTFPHSYNNSCKIDPINTEESERCVVVCDDDSSIYYLYSLTSPASSVGRAQDS